MSQPSKIETYLQMVRDGIKNGDKIIEAVATSALLKSGNASEEAVAEIMRRKDICAGCPYNSRNAKEARGYSSHLPFEHCTLCLCRIGYDDGKEYCLSCKCGVAEWNKRNPHLPPMELKWDVFEGIKKKTN